MTPVYEFVGGPWDGETRVLHEGNEVHIHLQQPMAGVSAITDEDVTRPVIRIGIYKRVRRRDAPPQGYFKWMGEHEQ